MDKKITTNGTEVTAALGGRLDTASAPELEAALGSFLADAEHFVLDFAELNYISSAGLRVLLSLQKKMNAKKGTMVLRHVNEMVMEVFEVTGFTDILTIEND